jgi:hypothetical protein
MNTAAKLISSLGDLISLCSKQALFLNFQMAQQIAASPAIYSFLLARIKRGKHQKNFIKLPGLLDAPTDVATELQTNFAATHSKKR